MTHPKAKALLNIFLADAGLIPFTEANAFAESVYLTPCHVDLQILFLAGWYGICPTLEVIPTDHMKALLSSLNALIVEETPIEIKTIVKLVQAHKSWFFLDYVSANKIYENITEGLSRNSPYYRKVATLGAWYYMVLGMGTKVLGLMGDMSPSSFEENGYTLAQFVNSALTGKIQDLDQLIQKIVNFPQNRYSDVISYMFRSSCNLITLISRVSNIPLESKTIIQNSDSSSSWVKSALALINYSHEESLHWARLHEDQPSTRAEQEINFVIHTLIRAELANRNGAGAKRLIMHLHEKGTQTYIDDFYLARAERLLGNFNLATIHFNKFKTSIHQYAAEKRLDFEVRLAIELDACDLLSLNTSQINISSTQQALTFSTKIPEKGVNALISASSSMKGVKNLITKFANLDFPVLITGDTGTGKELVARALHQESSRANKPFIAINCGSIPDALIESEFFGHSPRAFTGAKSAYNGIFREACDGTVFLDEIASISPQLQVALLRVIETGDIKPVGSSAQHIIKCRILAATNKPLKSLVQEGIFRPDLLYRLQQLEISIPPLCKRPEDIEEIAKYFLNIERPSGGIAQMSSRLIDRLKQHYWPGNVRELRNIVQRLRILSSDKLFYDVEDLALCRCELEQVATDSTLLTKNNDPQHAILEKGNALRRKKHLRELFEQNGELKVTEAASLLGVTPQTASKYIWELCEDGLVEKITPTASLNTHYFALKRITEH